MDAYHEAAKNVKIYDLALSIFRLLASRYCCPQFVDQTNNVVPHGLQACKYVSCERTSLASL